MTSTHSRLCASAGTSGYGSGHWSYTSMGHALQEYAQRPKYAEQPPSITFCRQNGPLATSLQSHKSAVTDAVVVVLEPTPPALDVVVVVLAWLDKGVTVDISVTACCVGTMHSQPPQSHPR